MSISDLYNSRYKEDLVKKFSIVFNNNYEITKKALEHVMEKGLSDKQIFKLFHTYYWKNIVKEPKNRNSNVSLRAKVKAEQLKSLLSGVDYSRKAYLDIGCEECIMPLSYGKVLGIDEVHCVNIEDWESHYNVNKSNMKKCNFKHYDGVNLPYEDNSFSVISTNMVLHHISPEDRSKLLKDIDRVLVDKGLLIIREHNSGGKLFDKYVDFIHRFYDSILLKEFHWVDDYHTYYQSQEEWRKELKGYKMVRSKKYDKRIDRPFLDVYIKL